MDICIIPLYDMYIYIYISVYNPIEIPVNPCFHMDYIRLIGFQWDFNGISWNVSWDYNPLNGIYMDIPSSKRLQFANWKITISNTLW